MIIFHFAPTLRRLINNIHWVNIQFSEGILLQYLSEAYSESTQKSKMELFVKILSDFKR